MTDNEILAMETFTACNHYSDKAHITVYYVARANFNDEMLVECVDIPFSELEGKPLRWIDPYFGRSKIGKTKIAFVYADSEALYVIVDDGEGKRTVRRIEKIMTEYLAEDYDKSSILSAHIR